jgi:hypothetical protein
VELGGTAAQDASTIRDPGAAVGDSAILALEVRGRPLVARISSATGAGREPDPDLLARRLHRSRRLEDLMYDDRSKNGAPEKAPQTTAATW